MVQLRLRQREDVRFREDRQAPEGVAEDAGKWSDDLEARIRFKIKDC
jgi:hypothetical protein